MIALLGLSCLLLLLSAISIIIYSSHIGAAAHRHATNILLSWVGRSLISHLLEEFAFGEQRCDRCCLLLLESPSSGAKVTTLALHTGLPIVLAVIRIVQMFLDIGDHLAIGVVPIGLIRILELLATVLVVHCLWLTVFTLLEHRWLSSSILDLSHRGCGLASLLDELGMLPLHSGVE